MNLTQLDMMTQFPVFRTQVFHVRILVYVGRVESKFSKNGMEAFDPYVLGRVRRD